MACFKTNKVVSLIVALILGGAEGGIFWPEGFGFHCFKPCFLSYSPVCGTDGNSVRTFTSSCDLLGYNCWHKKAFQQIKIGECDGTEDFVIERDSRFCPETWDPVCGSKGNEGKAFSNLCLLHAYNRNHLRAQFSMMNEGECDEVILSKQKSKNCSPCPKIYSPVCGKDGDELVTFPNECVMKNYNCFESRGFVVIQNEECPDKFISAHS